MSRKFVVIYTRFSSDMQRTESCEDQERDVRTGLLRRALHLSNVLVIRDEAVSGTKADRPGFQRLLVMIKAGQIGILAVDDQSRLTRGDDAMRFITNLVYSGGRFISTSENIDTKEIGWELKVKVMELQNGVAIRGLSDKVRRGQRGRVLADDSAGDISYGYETFYHDADWQQQLARRGPKPKKGIKINDIEAAWVRKIFDWFLERKSISSIAKLLTKEGAPKGHRTRTRGWHPQQVHRVLNNTKYIGSWQWGATTTIRDSEGRKKQIAVTEQDAILRSRPNLRIIDQDVWDRAQVLLRQLTERFGAKPGQAKRGPKAPINPASYYPRSILGGVLRCAACGEIMWYTGSSKRRYYSCSGHKQSRCDQGFQIRAEPAEKAVIDAVTRLVTDWPDWIRDVQSRLNELILREAERMPDVRADAERRLAIQSKQRDNLIDALAQGHASSPGLVQRLATVETEITQLEETLQAIRTPSDQELALPSESWVREQIEEWAQSFSDSQKVMVAIREAVERIDARPIIAPGKKHGYVELTLHYRAWELFQAAVGKRMPASLQNLMPGTLDVSAPNTEVIPLGGPTPMDHWAPEIARWRQEGVIWKEIVRRTGLDLNRVWRACKRYKEAQKLA